MDTVVVDVRIGVFMERDRFDVNNIIKTAFISIEDDSSVARIF